MIGIVLWSDPEDQKAVFWCEDQGDLAYFEGGGTAGDLPASLHAGDMVQFGVTARKNMRLAHDPQVLQEQACAGLPQTLRNAAPSSPTDAASARIIPFTRPDTKADEKLHAARKA